MTDADETRRKRLLFQSWHRGMKEMDLVLGRFGESHLARFTSAQLDTYEQLLEEDDADLWSWITGRAPVPDEVQSDVWALLRDFRYTA
jgi:antitoxin CptB